MLEILHIIWQVLLVDTILLKEENWVGQNVTTCISFLSKYSVMLLIFIYYFSELGIYVSDTR